MWRWYTLLSFRSSCRHRGVEGQVQAGRNRKDAKVALAREITARFHSLAAARCGRAETFVDRQPGWRAGGVSRCCPRRLARTRAPAGIAALLRQAGPVASGGEGNRLIQMAAGDAGRRRDRR
jgi:tyrosyl-tRNA synthetase